MSKTLKKLPREIGIFTGAGVSSAVGIRAIGGAGAAHGQEQGLANISGQMGLLGEVKGAGMLMGTLREVTPLYPAKGKKRQII